MDRKGSTRGWPGRIASAVIFLLTVAALPGAASAADGAVSGRIRFYNNMADFCPSSIDCTGARYTQSQFNVNMPIRDAKVYLVRDDGAVLGSGSTNASGDFLFNWFAWTWWWEDSVRARLEWYGEHRDGRFALRSTSGGRWMFWTAWMTIRHGTTTSSPQSLGTRTWGSASSPHALANLYAGAERMWRDSLNASARMRNTFTNVAIEAFDATECPTSCAAGWEKRVVIDSSASAFTPQSRIMHEMGHIASYLSNPYRGCGDYTFNGDTANPTWSLTSAEFSCASFEEGIATFFGDRAIYWQASPQPRTCGPGGTCFDTEASTGASSCAANEGRQALSLVRYVRDLYDTNDDVAGTSFFRFFDVLARFGTGTGNRGGNEPWNSSQSSLDDRDGRSGRDYRAHFEAETGVDSSQSFSRNCSPVGD